MESHEVVETLDLKPLGFSANAKPHHVAVEADGAHWYVSLIAAGRETEADARLDTLVGRHVEHAEAVKLMARRLEAREDESERAQQYSNLAERLRGIMERSEKPIP